MAYIAIAIFVVAYMLIISEKVQRTVVGLTGAMLMIFAGILTQEQAIHHIDFELDLFAGKRTQPPSMGLHLP